MAAPSGDHDGAPSTLPDVTCCGSLPSLEPIVQMPRGSEKLATAKRAPSGDQSGSTPTPPTRCGGPKDRPAGPRVTGIVWMPLPSIASYAICVPSVDHDGLVVGTSLSVTDMGAPTPFDGIA